MSRSSTDSEDSGGLLRVFEKVGEKQGVHFGEELLLLSQITMKDPSSDFWNFWISLRTTNELKNVLRLREIIGIEGRTSGFKGEWSS